MLIHVRNTGVWLARYWIVSIVIAFALLAVYTNSPIFGQSPDPTPNIQTVPKPDIVFTPTNTPFPTATSVAPEAPQQPEIPQVPTPLPTEAPTAKPTRSKAADSNTESGSGGGAGNVEAQPESTGQANQAANNPTAQKVDGPLTATVLVAVLNLRKGPGTGDAIIDTLFRNDQVQILGRNRDGVWWLVCCGSDAKKQGWVTAQLLNPNFDLAQANQRLPVAAGSSAVPPIAGAATAKASLGTPKTLTVTTSSPLTSTLPISGSQGVTLQLQMRPSPAFVWQGQRVNLQFVVTNRGTTPAINVRLRDDLTTTLQYSKAVISNNGRFQQQSKAQGGSIFSIAWPQLVAGASVTATVTLHIAADAPDGSLIDNLAVVAADNVVDVPAGITLAMPPTIMPQFK